MGSLFVLLVLIVVAVVLVSLLKGQQSGPSKEMSYEARKALFSPAERSFLGVLEQAVAGQYRIFGKVRLGDLIQPAKGYTKGQRMGAWNRINQKHVDFVLCQPETLAVVGAVELDDSSHRRKDRKDRDDFVDRALESEGIPLVRFAARKGYAVAEVAAKLAEVLSPQEDETESADFCMGGSGEQNSLKVAEGCDGVSTAKVPGGITSAHENTTSETEGEKDQVPSELTCSACNSPMVKRLAKKGPNAGSWFWACSAFPRCRMVVGDK
jgi:very-short-patch-repair endonuclease